MIKEHKIYKGIGVDEDGNLYSKIKTKHIKGVRGSVSYISDEWEPRVVTKCDNRATIRLSYYKKTIRMHRLMWECFHGEIPKGMEIDHIDRNPLNNKLENLRLASSRLQKLNRGKIKNCTSKYKGVYYAKSRNKWQAAIDGKWIGEYDNEIDAARHYDAKAEELNQGHLTNKSLYAFV